MLNSTSYSVIGLFLTLTGLLGTFFYVHLSNWLRDLFRLKAKWDVNKPGTDPQQLTAKRECKYEIKGLFNHIPVMVSVVVSGFIWLLYINAQKILSVASTDPIANQLSFMLTIFVSIYSILTLYFLIHGLILGWIMRRQMK